MSAAGPSQGAKSAPSGGSAAAKLQAWGDHIPHCRILILDFGAQYTQLIARRLRETNVYCEIHPWDVGDGFVRGFGARGVVLSGGPASVTEDAATVSPSRPESGERPSTICRPPRPMYERNPTNVETALGSSTTV